MALLIGQPFFCDSKPSTVPDRPLFKRCCMPRSRLLFINSNINSIPVDRRLEHRLFCYQRVVGEAAASMAVPSVWPGSVA